MDVNEYMMGRPLRKIIEAEGITLIEYSHKYCETKPLTIYINGNITIDAGYRYLDVEVTHVYMLSLIDSLGDYRSWIVETSAKLMTGKIIYKIERPVGSRLVC